MSWGSPYYYCHYVWLSCSLKKFYINFVLLLLWCFKIRLWGWLPGPHRRTHREEKRCNQFRNSFLFVSFEASVCVCGYILSCEMPTCFQGDQCSTLIGLPVNLSQYEEVNSTRLQYTIFSYLDLSWLFVYRVLWPKRRRSVTGTSLRDAKNNGDGREMSRRNDPIGGSWKREKKTLEVVQLGSRSGGRGDVSICISCHMRCRSCDQAQWLDGIGSC
jgi:hypothetical protein